MLLAWDRLYPRRYNCAARSLRERGGKSQEKKTLRNRFWQRRTPATLHSGQNIWRCASWQSPELAAQQTGDTQTPYRSRPACVGLQQRAGFVGQSCRWLTEPPLTTSVQRPASLLSIVLASDNHRIREHSLQNTCIWPLGDVSGSILR